MSVKVSVKRDECLVCKTQVEDRFWIYLWNGKQGFCCSECGEAVHTAGYKILETIENILKNHGVEDIYHKEKFGYYRLDATVKNRKQLNLAEALFNLARKDFPEFSFDFHAWLRRTKIFVQ